MNILQVIEDPALFGGLFKDISTWRPWIVFLRALFGLPIEDPEDIKLFRDCTGLNEPPRDRIRECAAICGRRPVLLRKAIRLELRGGRGR